MTELSDAIAAYHDALAAGDTAVETQGQLDEQLHRRGLFFGTRPICTVLRPRFLTGAQYRSIQATARVLLGALQNAYRVALANPGFRAQFGLADWEETLVQEEPGFDDPSPTARLDAFYLTDTDEVKFTEYNAETPASPAYNDVLTDVFLGLPVMAEFLRDFALRPLPARPGVLHALLDTYRQWSGTSEPPNIAIVDWNDVPTRSEFVLFQDYFAAQGFRCLIVDPGEVEYTQQVTAGGVPINLIYKRVLLSELIDRGGLNHPIVRAVRDGAVCMVNAFRCKILHKKASLAVLSDERNAHLFTPAEQTVIAAHVPWTRLVGERRTTFRDRPIDLIPFLLEHREQLVLKPNDEYGGKGVVLGWQVDQGAWEGAVRSAAVEPYVVQERVTLPREPYPSVIDGQVRIIERMQDTDPYVFRSAYVDGCLTRLSMEALLNVTAGGGSTVPTFVVERRA